MPKLPLIGVYVPLFKKAQRYIFYIFHLPLAGLLALLIVVLVKLLGWLPES